MGHCQLYSSVQLLQLNCAAGKSFFLQLPARFIAPLNDQALWRIDLKDFASVSSSSVFIAHCPGGADLPITPYVYATPPPLFNEFGSRKRVPQLLRRGFDITDVNKFRFHFLILHSMTNLAAS